jgi:transposase
METLCIDSLRERVIEAVAAARRGARGAERFEVSVASAIKWLQRWRADNSAAAKSRGGSVSPLEEFATEILAVIAEYPNLTLVETLAELRKRRIRASRSALRYFLDRYSITFKKTISDSVRLLNGSERTLHEHADLGYESKVFLIPVGSLLSTRLRSAQIWCGSGAVRQGVLG